MVNVQFPTVCFFVLLLRHAARLALKAVTLPYSALLSLIPPFAVIEAICAVDILRVFFSMHVFRPPLAITVKVAKMVVVIFACTLILFERATTIITRPFNLAAFVEISIFTCVSRFVILSFASFATILCRIGSVRINVERFTTHATFQIRHGMY
jgi:hypothetical protein